MVGNNDIAIVGMSCYFPGADNLREFWHNLVNGVSSITDVPESRITSRYFSDAVLPDVDRFYFNKGGFVSPIKIDPLQYGILPIAAEGIDPEQLAALHLVKEALTDAGVYEKKISLEKCCFILGKGNFAGVASVRIGSYTYFTAMLESIVSAVFPDVTEDELKQIREEYQSQLGRFQADTVAGAMPNLVVSLVSNKFNLRGPAYTLDGACASSILAVEHAMNLLLSGQCDIAIAGGMHLGQGASFWSAFHVIRAGSFSKQISPFSEDADGLLIGEGAGIVILKKLDKAIADKDRIYAVIKACSTGSDGSDVSVMAPSSKGQVETLKLAWDKAGMDPQKIGYVETHGTATQVGDRVEIATLTDFFGDNTAPPALLGSVKSNIGHAMPAAGIAGLIKTALALYHKKIPPTLHCEKPMKAVYQSRFLPVQQLTDWDEKKYPLVAGVNAFGFGGINTHIILESFSKQVKTNVSATKTELLEDIVISLSAQTKDELLSKLENKDYTVSEGNYRLVIFNPTTDKLKKAKSFIEKDKPWKGRLDIWFSNQPLLSKDEKVVFMFSGFDAGSKIDIQSIIDYYEIPHKQVEVANDSVVGHGLNHYYRSKLLDQALKKMGIIPDINIGHSLGEWHAAGASGCVSSESVEKLTADYNPEDYLTVDVLYVAVGCGYDKIKSWHKEIPDLHLANDNCPNQILMAGREDAINHLIERLKEEQIFYQIMPFKSGFHTPLFPEDALQNFKETVFSVLEYLGGNIPLWSSTILKEYPPEREKFFSLLHRHALETVRFRELIETLYDQENARMFIQIGIGPLAGFAEDTLKGKPVSIISTIHPSRSGLEQMRRIAALLFIEGKTVNKELISITEENSKKKNRLSIPLNFSYATIRKYPTLQEVFDKYMERIYVESSAIPAFSVEKIENPVLQSANDNLQEIASLQENMLNWYRSNTSRRVIQKVQNGNYLIPVAGANLQRMGNIIEKTIRFDLNDHPYLLDHIVVRQPNNRALEELNPVVPFAMTIETLCEYTEELAPGKKILGVSSAGVQKWIPVKEPFVEKITGEWKTDNCISWMLPGYAFGDVTIGDAFPSVPEEYIKDIDLGDSILPAIPPKQRIYSFFLFHGPRYQSIIEVIKLTKKGLHARIYKAEGKGSMMDNLGQLLGMYCHLALDENQTTFPMSVDEILFYQDFHDQKGIFDYNLVIKEIREHEAISKVIIKRDGKIWCIVNGWHNRRLDYSRNVMNVIMRPKQFILAKQLNDNIFYYYYDVHMKISVMEFLFERYLNLAERKHHRSLYPNQARDYLISRIALKDGVRKYLQKEENEEFIFPIEISVRYNEQGKPFLYGHERVNGIEVSIAHKGSESVVMVSDKPVGIDIEKIEVRTKEFMEITFTPHELDLLKEKEDETEWIARFWVAKEAYGKMLGSGLQGNPKQYEIESVTGDEIIINNRIIKTSKHKTDFIIGWTL